MSDWHVRDTDYGEVGPLMDERARPRPHYGRRRGDLHPWVTVSLAALSTVQAIALAWIASGH